MTIDEIIEELEDSKDYPTSDPASDEALNGAIEIMRKYQMFQDQSLSMYMERLKADMVAMLEEIQLEIEEYDVIGNHSTGSYEADLYNGAYSDGMSRAASIVGEKIDKLKESD